MYKLLIVEDDSKIRRSIKRHLVREGYEVEEAENGKQALEQLTVFQADLIVLDVMMPVMNGYELCKILKADSRLKDLFVLMISARAKKEDEIIGLSFGADDYLTKPFDPMELLDRIKTGLATVTAKKLANSDPLTGLYNRYYFNSIFSRELARCERSDNDLAVVMLAVDRFREFEDRLGKSAAQNLLQEVAVVLRRNSRQIDIYSRCRNEIFAVLLLSTPLSGANSYAEKIRIKIEKHTFSESEKVTASFGVSVLKECESGVFDSASQALQQAIVSGGNQVKSL